MSQSLDNETLPFEFSGKGGEYFRIWIVNLALTILTLGIYSAWAKVRRQQYFYRNTSLAGSSFDYHGEPLAILKGRLIGVAMLVLYSVSERFDPRLGLVAFAVLMAVMPWLVQRSLRFKLHNSSFRGLRFAFDGTLGDAYRAFLLWPVVGYLTLGLLAPIAHQRIKAYQHGNSRYGTEEFQFDVKEGQFYKTYFKLFGLVILLLIGVAVVSGTMAGAFSHFGRGMDKEAKAAAVGLVAIGIVGFYLLAFLFIAPWFAARIQNLVWNGTALGQHGFASAVRARDLFWIYLTNFVGILVTLGLFKPFADIRLARYRLEHMALNAQGSLDAFLAGQQPDVSAMGEETADVFDFDISF